jgi:uncharacterized protein with ParB-like and HNH nuclease domain
MQVGTLAVQYIFEKDVLYKVPLYQRPYVWKAEEQWQPLWNDLQKLAEALIGGEQPRAHFLGASVQDRPAVPPGHIETRLLIDGQQRLTTLQLLLRAFEDVAKQEDDNRYHLAIGKLIRNQHPLSTEDYEAFKIWPTNSDRDDFRIVMETTGRDEIVRSYGFRTDAKSVGKNIPDGYLFFHRAISEWLGEDQATKSVKIPALYSAIRDNVRLVVIDLDEKDDAQLIFETLNARGTPLLSADLVKNSLLSEIEEDGGNAEKAYQKYWQPFDVDTAFWRSEVGRGHARRARIELFLQNVLTLLTGTEVSTSHLYAAYKDYSLGPDAREPEDRLEAIKRYGDIYRLLVEGHKNPRVALFMERLNVMDIGTAYPFLLSVFDKLGDQEELLVEVLSDIEAFLVRRMVCRLSTRGYNRLFVDLLSDLNGEADQIPAQLRESLMARTAEFDRWPSDSEFAKAWTNNPLYENLSRPRLRLLLEAIEAALRGDFAETKEVPRNLTVEHVLPQKWHAHWPLPGIETEAEETILRGELLHTIGNLSLLNEKLNPAQSNHSWLGDGHDIKGKKKALEKHSVLYLNKDLCEHENWSEQEIVDRSNRFLDLAMKVWPYPGTDLAT